MRQHTRNITREYRSASEQERTTGLEWYAEAFRQASDLAEINGISVSSAVGIIAVLSPRVEWHRNIALAWTVVRTGTATGVLTANLRKAQRILEGEHAENVMGGEKVTSFYRNIMSSGMDTGVTIDRHAIDVAEGKKHNDDTRPAAGKRAYAEYSEAYRRAATILSREEGRTITPAQIQAVTWTTWRARNAWKKAAA